MCCGAVIRTHSDILLSRPVAISKRNSLIEQFPNYCSQVAEAVELGASAALSTSTHTFVGEK